jgi:dihydrofolate reductase
MVKPRLSIIAAVAEKDGAIGKDNKLLWDIPEDLEHFKKTTLGHPVIMGSRTFESLPGGALPNRVNIVLSDEKDYYAKGAIVVNSLDDALTEAEKTGTDEVFVIGGGFVYSQYLPKADRLYLTLVEGNYEADTYFPDYSQFTEVVSEISGKSVNGYKYRFMIFEK